MKQCKHNLKTGVQNFGLQKQAIVEWLQDLMQIFREQLDSARCETNRSFRNRVGIFRR